MIAALSLSSLYQLAGLFFENSWLPPLVVNGILSVIVIYNWKRKNQAPLPTFVPKLVYFLPSLVTLLAIIVAIIISRSSIDGAPAIAYNLENIIFFVVLVPIVEELVFRAGFGPIFIEKGGIFWGIYWTALLFSLCHTMPTFSDVLHLNISLPLGPFLLGIICHWIYHKSATVLPAIVFHSVCNASVYIFSTYDHRWIDWLNLLYM